MKGEIRVAYGDRKGTLFALNSSVIIIGRNAAADVSINWDPFVAHKHCRLEFIDEDFLITDLGSPNGTQVNDQRIVARQKLNSGDFIHVGFTILQFTAIPNAATPSANSPSVETLDRDQDDASLSVEAPSVAMATATATPLATIDYHKIHYFDAGDTTLSKNDKIHQKPLFDHFDRLYGPLQDETSSSRILAAFAHSKPEPLFIVDFSLLSDLAPPPCDPNYSILFDWLPKSTALQLPCLYAMSELTNWKMILEEHWGKDAFVALISKHSKAKTIELLRRRLRYDNGPATDNSEKQDSQAAYGYCWPSILTRLIEMNVEGFGKKFMADFELIFSEDQSDPANWSLIGPRTIIDSHRKRHAVLG